MPSEKKEQFCSRHQAVHRYGKRWASCRFTVLSESRTKKLASEKKKPVSEKMWAIKMQDGSFSCLAHKDKSWVDANCLMGEKIVRVEIKEIATSGID